MNPTKKLQVEVRREKILTQERDRIQQEIQEMTERYLKTWRCWRDGDNEGVKKGVFCAMDSFQISFETHLISLEGLNILETEAKTEGYEFEIHGYAVKISDSVLKHQLHALYRSISPEYKIM